MTCLKVSLDNTARSQRHKPPALNIKRCHHTYIHSNNGEDRFYEKWRLSGASFQSFVKIHICLTIRINLHSRTENYEPTGECE